MYYIFIDCYYFQSIWKEKKRICLKETPFFQQKKLAVSEIGLHVTVEYMGMESARWYCITCEIFTLHHNTIALYLIAMYNNMHLDFSSLLVSSYSKWMYFPCMHVLGFIKSVESLALLSANTNRHTLETSDRNCKASCENFIYPVRCSLHLTEVHHSVFSFLLYT